MVLSPVSYNGRVGLALFCLITRQVKGYPLEAPLPEDPAISGVILSDQIRSLDWRGRNAEMATTLSEEIIEQVLDKLSLLLPRPN